MYRKNSIRWAAGLAFMLCLQWTASTAGVLLGGTRLIAHEKKREASISMKNMGPAPYVVQAWIDAGEGGGKTPFIVTPPLSRLDPGMENSLRVMRGPAGLPNERESVFWLNVKEIPEKSSEENVLQVAVRTRIKLFYRPAGLIGNASEAREKLQWAVSNGDEGGGAVLKIANPTPYHVTLTSLDINEGQQEINADMLAPFGELVYPLTAIERPQEIEVTFSTLDDYGAQTPRERIKVPPADRPSTVKAEVVKKPATSAHR